MIQPTRFLDLRDGNGKIAIAHQRGCYQLFQPRIAKKIPPADLHRAFAKRGLTRIAGGVARREIGRASCRDRVCRYVEISVVADPLTKKEMNKDRLKINTIET